MLLKTKTLEPQQANFPNLRRLFIEARTDSEERDVSRKAVRHLHESDATASTMVKIT